jgi:hypothetical protein
MQQFRSTMSELEAAARNALAVRSASTTTKTAIWAPSAASDPVRDSAFVWSASPDTEVERDTS